AQTAGLTDSYQRHREMVMQLISSTVKDLLGTSGEKCSSLVLLGAGNCMDVDLPKLTELFKMIHLVDLDSAAAVTAVERSEGNADQFKIHAPVDIAEPLLSLTSRDLRAEEDNREQCIKVLQALSAENAVHEIPEADVVISLCVFTQMIDCLCSLIPEGHPTFTNALKAIRIGHLRRMLSMLRPGGVAIFVTDTASSKTAPILHKATDATIAEIVKQLVVDKNFYSGTNPAMLLADLNVLSRLPNGPDTVHTTDPWIWHIDERALATYAFRIQKKLPVKEETEMADVPESN
ncbi:MAG: hypothetical protein WBH50_24175, partial [Fuerstiella sp.]